MLHPIVVITHESDDAIKQAVMILKDAGHSVKVLETPKSMLVDFLGALAGVEDGESPEKTSAEKTGNSDGEADNEEAPEKTSAEKTGNSGTDNGESPEKTSAEKTGNSDMIEPIKMEGVTASIDGILVDVYAGQKGCLAVLHPQMRSLTVESANACKITYQINEATFKQWVPSSDFTVTNHLSLKRDDVSMQISATLGEPKTKTQLVIDPTIVASMLG